MGILNLNKHWRGISGKMEKGTFTLFSILIKFKKNTKSTDKQNSQKILKNQIVSLLKTTKNNLISTKQLPNLCTKETTVYLVSPKVNTTHLKSHLFAYFLVFFSTHSQKLSFSLTVFLFCPKIYLYFLVFLLLGWFIPRQLCWAKTLCLKPLINSIF